MNIRQKLLNISVNHIRKQGKPSTDEYNTCRYKGPEGLSCAAAPFILEYNPEMEGKNFRGLIKEFPDNLMPEAREEMQFVSLLQWCHDEALYMSHSRFRDFMTEYEKFVAIVAEDYKLEIPD